MWFEGDLVLLSAPPGWVLSHGDDVRLEIFEGTYARADGRAACVGDPGSSLLTQLLGGQMSFDSSHPTLLRGMLPTMLHIPSAESSSGQSRCCLYLDRCKQYGTTSEQSERKRPDAE